MKNLKNRKEKHLIEQILPYIKQDTNMETNDKDIRPRFIMMNHYTDLTFSHDLSEKQHSNKII